MSIEKWKGPTGEREALSAESAGEVIQLTADGVMPQCEASPPPHLVDHTRSHDREIG